MPCRLTQVKGHANSAGLQSGDRLHVVNGENVEQLSHDEVVQLITSAPNGRLKLCVSSCGHESYCSSTSDAEEDETQHSHLSRYPDSDDSSSCTSTSSTLAGYGCRKSCGHRHSRQRKPLTNRAKRNVRTVLRPSQTYEHRVPSTRSRRTKRTYTVNSDGEPTERKVSHQSRIGQFKSIDNLLLPTTDDDELLLHQHYRNRLKCRNGRNAATECCRVSTTVLSQESQHCDCAIDRQLIHKLRQPEVPIDSETNRVYDQVSKESTVAKTTGEVSRKTEAIGEKSNRGRKTNSTTSGISSISPSSASSSPSSTTDRNPEQTTQPVPKIRSRNSTSSASTSGLKVKTFWA